MRNAKIESLTPGPTLIEQAYDAILSAICDGRLAPGARLHQDDLAGRLRISRQPVGQALSILKAQGFVRDNGRRGLIVAPLEREFLQAIYQLREALDAMAARLAAQRSSPADIAEGRALLLQGFNATASGRIAALIDADMRFHMWIYRVAGNPLLADTMRLYWNHLRRAMAELLQQPASRKNIWAEHEAILEAIARHDAKTAGQRALAHVRDASERIGKLIPPASAPLEETNQVLTLSPGRAANARPKRRKSSA